MNGAYHRTVRGEVKVLIPGYDPKRTLALSIILLLLLGGAMPFFAQSKAPDPVPLTVKDTGLGGSVDLDWSGYNETAQGGVASYEIFTGASDFSNVTGMTPMKALPAGTFKTRLSGLENLTLYHFAVVAVDGHSNRNTTVKTVSGRPSDITPPAAPKDLKVIDTTSNSINLSWAPNTEPDLAGYKIWINETGAGTAGPFKPKNNGTVQLMHNVTSVGGLQPGTNYCFAVKSIDKANPPNPSNLSASVCGVTKPKQPSARVNTGAVVLLCVSVITVIVLIIVLIIYFIYKSQDQTSGQRYPQVDYRYNQPAYQPAQPSVPPVDEAKPQARPEVSKGPSKPPAKKLALRIPESTGEGRVLIPKDLPSGPEGAAQASHRAEKKAPKDDKDVMIIEDVEEVRPGDGN